MQKQPDPLFFARDFGELPHDPVPSLVVLYEEALSQVPQVVSLHVERRLLFYNFRELLLIEVRDYLHQHVPQLVYLVRLDVVL